MREMIVGLLVVGAAWVCGFLSASTSHCDGCAKSGHEVSRLTALNAKLTEAIGNWITRTGNCEARIARYETEAAEAKAIDDRMWAGVQKRMHMEHSRIGITLPSAVCDSEAATEVLQLCVGPWEIDR